MRIGIMFVFVDYHRKGQRRRNSLQPQIGPLIAGLLPREAEVEIINETWREPDWNKHYDLLFLSCMHSDFDRARQISHYWRRRGAKTVIGGAFASGYPSLCQPYFDAVAVGDPEGSVQQIYRDFCHGKLQPYYQADQYVADQVVTPRFDLLTAQGKHALCLEATRGCPFTCEFCVLTGLGTRHHVRPVERVLHDIAQGQSMLRPLVGRHQRNVVGFCDNNIGGNLPYLRQLCAALRPLRLQWYGAASFNVIANRELVDTMARAGCRALFVGLESFNPNTLEAMHKHQNVVRKIKSAIEYCRQRGILIVSGLMLSPGTDDVKYIRAIPRYLRDCSLHVPTFICFESPIPGTPHFLRLAREAQPALLPNALLRDFTGYTLVTQPKLNSTDEFVAAYKQTLTEVYSMRNRLRKLSADLPQLLGRGYWFPALVDTLDILACDAQPAPGRSMLAGSDLAPPEEVPLTDADFDSEEQRRLIMDPWRVTDPSGRVLTAWLQPNQVFDSQAIKHGKRLAATA